MVVATFHGVSHVFFFFSANHRRHNNNNYYYFYHHTPTTNTITPTNNTNNTTTSTTSTPSTPSTTPTTTSPLPSLPQVDRRRQPPSPQSSHPLVGKGDQMGREPRYIDRHQEIRQTNQRGDRLGHHQEQLAVVAQFTNAPTAVHVEGLPKPVEGQDGHTEEG